MSVALQIACAVLAIPFLLLGVAKLLATEDMRNRAAHLGYRVAAYRAIGAAEVLAAVGLLSAHVAAPLAVAALSGLGLLLVGAVVSHVRNGDGLSDLTPAVVLLLLVVGVGAAAVSS